MHHKTKSSIANMKFWCASANSSKQRKSINTQMMKLHDSFSSSASYASISSIPAPKSDSGYSDTTSNSPTYSYVGQALQFERTYHEHLKQWISKYSRPLRRVLNPQEIVDLFQNIEKICSISQAIVRQCESFLLVNPTCDVRISSIYQSTFGVMIDSYNTYLSQSIKAQSTLKQCEKKISSALQVPIESIRREISDFIYLPIRYIEILNDLCQSFMIEYANQMNSTDWNIVQTVQILSERVTMIRQSQSNDLDSSADLTLQSEVSPTIVLHRTDKEPWESKRLELSDSRLLISEPGRTSRICLSNVVRINEDFNNRECHLIIATSASKHSRYSSMKMKNIYIRFDNKHDYIIWLECLTHAIQQAKDHNWSKTNELVI